jgi:hypothetical protein
MHVIPGKRCAALKRLSDLLSPDGVPCLGFRAVTDADLGRGMYPIHVLEVSTMACDLGLRFQYETTGDVLGRNDIAW